jgi:hypothetical protein
MKMSRMRLVFLAFNVSVLGMALLTANAFGQADEPGPGTPYSPLPTDKVVVTKVKHFGVVTWKIAAAGGTLYYENGNETGGSVGYNSLFDKDGNDWVGADDEKGFNKVPGCPGWGHKTRGFPKFTGGTEFETPTKKAGGKTRWMDADGKDLTFADKLEATHLVMRSSNDTWEFEYHFFPTHVAIKVIKAGGSYAFHFQGLIGGEPDASPKDHYVLKDGKKRDIGKDATFPAEFTGGQFPSPFLYMEDSDEKKTQVFYMAAKNITAAHMDEAWYATCGETLNVAIFSFGRKPGSSNYTLTGTDSVFLFGFQPKASGHEAISGAIEALLADPFKGGSGGTPTGGTTATGGTTGGGGATSTGGTTGTGGGTASSGGTTATSGGTTATSGGTTATSGGTPASGGSTSTSGSGGTAAGGQTSSGGSQASGGSTSKADAGTSTPSKSSSGGCSVGQVGGVPGAGFLFAFAALTLWLSGRRRKR